MRKLIVVNNPAHWSFDVSGVEIISSKAYLTQPEFSRIRNVRVFNLSREYRYQAKGYYVSLLAEARGQKVIPSVKTILDLKSPVIVRIVSDELDNLIERSLRRIKSSEFVLSIYFGQNMAKQYRLLARELYKLFQAPLLRARFVRGRKWSIQSVRAISLDDIPEPHMPYVQAFAQEYFQKKRHTKAATDRFIYDLAILYNPGESEPPSDARALAHFMKAGEELGFSVEMITRDDYDRVGEFDALLIRETTAVSHHTYRFARRAQSDGLVVIDDPDVILRCSNKVYLAELLQGARIPVPKTVVCHTDNQHMVESDLGLPCVLKLPDSSFSRGVVRVDSSEQLRHELGRMLNESDLVIAQAYTPTDFDWRIGVLDGEVIFACKYLMAKGHWQIYNWAEKRTRDRVGAWETVPVGSVPVPVRDLALRATALIGDGLFGVDIKEVGESPMVIEINDNPNVEAGVEDAVLGDQLYLKIVGALKSRIEKKLGVVRGANAAIPSV